MISFPPFLGFNPYYRRPYNSPYTPYTPKDFHNQKSGYARENIEKTSDYMKNKKTPQYGNDFQDSSNNAKKHCTNNSNDNDKEKNAYEPFFSIFGIDLYFDDILILALLLFLNNEDVKDSYLYIILLMLLFN